MAELDKKATTKEVEYFLKEILPHVVRAGGHQFTDFAKPKFFSVLNNTPHIKECAEIVEADKVLHAVHSAIQHCSKISRIIIISLYFEDKRVKEILPLINYGSSQYHSRFKPEALLEFARQYEKYQVKYGVAEEDILNFKIYS